MTLIPEAVLVLDPQDAANDLFLSVKGVPIPTVVIVHRHRNEDPETGDLQNHKHENGDHESENQGNGDLESDESGNHRRNPDPDLGI